MNRLRSVNHQALKTGELLVREGLTRQQDVDAALDVQSLASSGLDGADLSSAPADSTGRNRSDDIPEGIGIRTLITLQAIIISICFILLAIGGSVFESSFIVWAIIIVIFFISLPLSSAVNTFFYFSILEAQNSEEI